MPNYKNLEISKKQLIENPTPRIPICLVLDCSPSMSGKVELGAAEGVVGVPIDALNEGIKTFYKSICQDELAKYAAEISIVAFSGVAEEVIAFEPPNINNIPVMELELDYGGTSIGSAMTMASQILQTRKLEYKNVGVDYYQPWIVLMTDGQPTDETHLTSAPIISKLVIQKKLTVFSIGIGEQADMQTLAMFNPNRPPLKLQGLKFNSFFEWLSKSVSRVSVSTPGDSVKLDTEGLKGWASI